MPYVPHPHIELARRLHLQAFRRYDRAYNNELYLQATRHLDVQTCSLLVDDALALCGSPFHPISFTRWDDDQQRFLLSFAPTNPVV